MTIITRTILKEHIGPFFYGIATIVFVFLLNIVFRDLGRLLGKGLPFIVLIKFFYLNLAWIVALAVPMSMLLASLMAFGRLSADNEITALKASGIHFYRILSPVILAAAILTVFMIPFNNKVLPEFNHQWRILFSDVSRTRPTLTLEPDVFFDNIPNYTILVHRLKEKKNLLEDIVIHDMHDYRFNKTIIAQKGQFNFYKEEERMVLTLYNGEIHEIEKDNLENYRRMRFTKQSFSITISDMVYKQSTTEYRGNREKSAGMMMQDLIKNRKSIIEKEQNIRSGVQSDIAILFPEKYFLKDVAKLSNSARGYLQNSKRIENKLSMIQAEISEMKIIKESIASLRVEINKKYSIPIACLVFVLVGAPLGVMIKQSGIATAGWLSIVFYLIYWSLLIGGEELADRMLIHPIVAMWSANLVVGAAGILFVIQTASETSLFRCARRIAGKIKGFITS